MDAMRINIDLSRHAADIIQAEKQECYRNAVMALLNIDDFKHGYYVEGLAINPKLNFPTEHGWVELDGEVVDPTWTLGTIDDAKYYPVMKYDSTTTYDLFVIRQKLMPLNHFGNCPALRDLYIELMKL